MKSAGMVDFAARRRSAQDEIAQALHPKVEAFLAGGNSMPLLTAFSDLFEAYYEDESDTPMPSSALDAALKEVADALAKADENSSADATTLMLALVILNGTTHAAARSEGLALEWVTMHDSSVREAHREVDGQQRQPGEPFEVGGVEMRYPGDPTAPIDLWINCRCVLRGVQVDSVVASDGFAMRDAATTRGEVLAAVEQIEKERRSGASMWQSETTEQEAGEIMADDDTTQEEPQEPIDGTAAGIVPWHGVLAIEGRDSGDTRYFEPNSLTHRVMSDRNGLPLTWQKKSSGGHDDADTVAGIAGMGRDPEGRIWGWGWVRSTPEADEFAGYVAEFGKIGVSIDADDAVLALSETDELLRFQYGRIASACAVNIPALAHAWVGLGPLPDDVAETLTPLTEAEATIRETAEASGQTVEEYLGLEPAGDDEVLVASIDDQVAAMQRRTLKVFPNDYQGQTFTINSADTVQMKRGPGWITNPTETRRLHNYWTKPGQPGYIKINWGVPGDFDRCRTFVGAEIAKHSPEDMRFLNQICAQWHHDALGIWPGQEAALVASAAPGQEATISIVAAAEVQRPPKEWFENPNFDHLTPTTITDEGRIFGHIAGWNTCHISSGQYGSDCLTPPRSETQYAYFLTGEIVTDGGPVPIGQITVGGGHAAGHKGYRAALAHYDESGTAVADITVGEDEFGIWYSGAMRPGATEEDKATLLAHPLSGDWRRIPRVAEKEMVAALCVNTGGFPIPRIGFADGTQVSLVAAGVVDEEETGEDPVKALASAVVTEMEERQKRRDEMAALMAKVREDH